MSPDELKLFQVDPLREERLKQSDLVVCRECGEKHKDLHHHVSKYHNLALEEYRERWNYPPVSAPNLQERRRERSKKQFEGRYFGGKRHVLKPGEATAARRGKPATAAMRRNGLRNGERLRGKPRLDRRGIKLLGKNRKNGVWVQSEPVDDARIADPRLAGRSTKEIAAEVGLTDSGVYWRLCYLGFSTGAACRFLHGRPVVKQDVLDLCADFGLTKRFAIGLARRSYFSVLNHLSHLESADPLTTYLGDSFLGLRKTLIDKYCFYEASGKRARHFLRSELRDLSGLRERIRRGLIDLRAWMRSNPAAQPNDVLNWLCEQSRREVADGETAGITTGVFQGLLFLWPSLRALNDRKPDLLAGRRFIDEVVDEVLSMEYSSTPSRIARAANGEFTPLDPRTLGQRIWEGSTADKRKRGRHREAEEDKNYFKIGAKVEKRIPTNLKRDKHSIVEARRSVSDETHLQFDVVAQYHKKYRRACAKPGIKIPA